MIKSRDTFQRKQHAWIAKHLFKNFWYVKRFEVLGSVLSSMDANETSNYSNSSIDTEEESGLDPVIPPAQVQFWTYLIVELPSLACTIFLLYHLLFQQHLRRALHNHIIIILLVLVFGIQVFDNPLYIDANRLGGHKNSFTMIPSICLMWWFFDYGFYGAITVFMAWGSIERHILVFHHQLIRTWKQKVLVHYLPLLLIAIYMLGFYIGVILYPPCENTFDFESFGCGFSPCYEEVSYLNLWDYSVNGILCTFIETVFSIGLLVRVLWQKRRAHQPVNWRKHRKMAMQLISISTLTLTVVFPQSLIVVIQHVGGPFLSNFGAGIDPYLFYLYTFVVLFIPFICLGSLPELWPKLYPFSRKRRLNVGPMTLMVEAGQSVYVKPRISR